MKKTTVILTLVFTAAVVFMSCGSKRQTGKIYMPDMAYSRAFESYAERDSLVFTTDINDRGHKIFYNTMPPAGTVKRGELFPFPVVPDNNNGTVDSAALLLSSQVKNPLPPLTGKELEEAGRLFNINCAVCHGAKAEANGPLAPKIGGVKSIIAASPGFGDGKIFYIITYGQNNMGSYASQLSREQRWRIVQYIRTLEPKNIVTETAVPKADSAKAKK